MISFKDPDLTLEALSFQSEATYKYVGSWVSYYELAWEIRQPMALRAGLACAVMASYGIKPPTVTSGYRPPEYQKELQARWDAGNREGLSSRPATRSWHMEGLAIDFQTGGRYWGWFIHTMKQLGCRYGGDFRNPSPNHFDFPIGSPKTIDQLLAS